MSAPIPFNPSINLPINADYYQPNVFVISNLSLGPQTVVTTSVDNNYVVGQLVRLLIPNAYGSSQISGQEGYVTSINSDDQFVVGINSTLANAFIPSPSYGPTPPQVVAIGDVNTGQINTGRSGNLTYVPGSFINISPA